VEAGRVDMAQEDWQALVKVAEWEGVAPLLSQRSTMPGGYAIPEESQEALRRAYYTTSAQNAILYDELGRVLARLEQAGIEVIVLKGADLAQTLYGDIGLRPMADVDLLVPQARFQEALSIAEGMGYENSDSEAKSEMQEVVNYHVHLVGGVSRLVNLELHWNLVTSTESWYAIPVEWFWEHSEPFMRTKAGKLSVEANLLYLVAHAVLQHGVRQSLLIWLYDIHALVMKHSEAIRWKWLKEEALGLGWAPALVRGLRECRKLFGTPVPEEVLNTLPGEADRRVARLVDFKADFPGARLLYDWYTLMALRWPERLRYAAALAFPSKAYIDWRYHPKPGWSWPIYYPYRWVLMIRDILMAMGQGLWRYAAR
jgi:hypothetical protein